MLSRSVTDRRIQGKEGAPYYAGFKGSKVPKGAKRKEGKYPRIVRKMQAIVRGHQQRKRYYGYQKMARSKSRNRTFRPGYSVK